MSFDSTPIPENTFARALADNISSVVSTPESIDALRKLIVSFALAGRFSKSAAIEQSQGELLDRTRTNHLEDVNHRNRKSPIVEQHPVSPEEIPHEGLSNLSWIRLSAVCDVEKGNTPILKAVPGPFPLVTTGEQRGTHSDYQFDAEAVIVPLVSSTGHGHASLKRLHFQAGRFALGNILCAIIPRDSEALSARFLYEFLSAYKDELLVARMSGTANVSLTINKILDVPIPIIPVDAQRRVCELMGLCDELAARQAAQREKRQRLVGATLNRLVSPLNPAEFPTHAHRFRNHFDQLFDTPTTIPQLRQTILQLAVQGQLVPQDPDDEPVDTLLRRLVDEKERLQKSGEFKLQDGPVAVADKEKLFAIPHSWKWVRAADLSFPISSGSTPAKDVFQETSEKGVPYLKVYNIRNQKIDFDYCPQFIRKPHHDAKMKRSKLVPGMVVLNIVGPPLGKTAIVPPTFPEWNCNQAIAFFRLVGDVLPEYIHLYFCAGLFLRNIELIGTAGQDNISVTKCKNIVIPLPPLAEQKRIVTKVTELLSLCDALEAKLTQTESASTKLLSAAVHHLLNESSREGAKPRREKP